MLRSRGGDAALYYAAHDVTVLLEDLGISGEGLDARQVARSRARYGSNAGSGRGRETVLDCLRRAFVNPFSIVLLVLAAISFATDVLLGSEYGRNATTPGIIVVMLLASGVVRLLQELRAKRVADRLEGLAHIEALARRDGAWGQVPAEELVVGDLVRLVPGDRVPADLRLTEAEDLRLTQSAITGESAAREKTARTLPAEEAVSPATCDNIALKGSVVVGGRGEGVVLAVGADAALGAPRAPVGRKDGFDRGAASISRVLIRFMLVLVPLVFVASGLTKGDWLSAFLFAVSVAVGLTPELLPMVASACLARGAAVMGRKRVAVRTVNAMQGFGSMDVLCVDKTGSLTGDEVTLEYYLDVLGAESPRALALGYLGGAYGAGVRNPLDAALVRCAGRKDVGAALASCAAGHPKLDELPFDHERRIASVLVAGGIGDIGAAGGAGASDGASNTLVVKGAVDEVCRRCRSVEFRGELIPMGDDARSSVRAVVDGMQEDGMKVLAVAYRSLGRDELDRDDELDLVLVGYLAFFDAPKAGAAEAVARLQDLHVPVKVLTGDNRRTAASICRRLGIATDRALTGAELDRLDDAAAAARVAEASVLSELSPGQKARAVGLLQGAGRTVGFLGDGMNDLPAMLAADVGISVDTAVEAVREGADVILLKKDLGVLADGVMEGRRAFQNMVKYIKITASSNFGNILSIVVASVLLPFLPMTSVQLLLLNLLYDVLCLALPWDRVDAGTCMRPLEWSGRTLGRFMRSFGPVSSLFDIATFAFLFWVLCPAVCGAPYAELAGAPERARFMALFHTGWFLESMWTQVLILHLLRSERTLSRGDRPAPAVIAVTCCGVAVLTALALGPVGGAFGLTSLPAWYLAWLVAVVACYLLLVSLAKRAYIRRFRRLL